MPPKDLVHPSLKNLLNTEAPVRPSLDNLLNPSTAPVSWEKVAFSDVLNSLESVMVEPADEPAQEDCTVVDSEPTDSEMQVDEDSVHANEDVPKPATTSGLNPAWASVFGNANTNLKRTLSQQSNSFASFTDKPSKKKVKIAAEPVGGPIGQSKAARSEKKAREEADNGVCKDPAKREDWKKRILQIDPHAEFYEDQLRAIRCSNCGEKKMATKLNSIDSFKDHHCRCVAKGYDQKKAKSKTAHTSTLPALFKRLVTLGKVITGKREKFRPEPCPGLTVCDDQRIPLYLKRSSAAGGGGRSVAKIAGEIFSNSFTQLSRTRKTHVLLQQAHEQRWRNDHQGMRVFSTTCATTCNGHSKSDARPLPCQACASLLKLHRFQTILNKPTPANENYKYINTRFRNPLIGEQYAKVKGLKELLDAAVSSLLSNNQ